MNITSAEHINLLEAFTRCDLFDRWLDQNIKVSGVSVDAIDAVDILNFTPGVTFMETYENPERVNFEGVDIRIIDIRDLIRNKESLRRAGEKSILDKYDAEVLKKILRNRKDP